MAQLCALWTLQYEEKMKIIKLPDVMRITSLSRASIYAFIQKGQFPRQIRLGQKSVGWLSSEIESWITQRADMRGGE